MLNTKEGRALVVTTASRNVQALRVASEKYSVKLPDAKYIIMYAGGQYEYYYELEGYGITEYAFGLLESCISQMTGQQAEDENDGTIREHALLFLENNLDNMCWDNILAYYLGEEGIEYEDG